MTFTDNCAFDVYDAWQDAYWDRQLTPSPALQPGLSSASYPPSDHSSRKPLRLNLCDLYEPTQLNQLLDWAIPYTHVFICDKTLYLLDVSSYPETDYNTILFKLDGPPVKSTETTGQIIDKHCASKDHHPAWSTLLANSLGYKSRLPYIIGEDIFLPDRGTSKQNASWLALHQVRFIEYDAGKHQVFVYCFGDNKITLPGDKKTTEKHLMRCANLYYLQHELFHDSIKNFDCVYINEPKSYQNIIHRLAYQSGRTGPSITCYDFLHHLIFLEAQRVLQSIIKESNPYIDDIHDYYRLKKFDDDIRKVN